MDETKFYENVITWENLLKKGYFDFQEYNNPYNIDSTYGKTDVIYPNYFNLKNLANNDELLKKIEQLDYKKIDTTPILFTIPKNDNSRRPLKFPNLYAYCNAVKVVIEHKNEIIESLISDKESTSRFFGYAPFTYSVTKSIENKLIIGHSFYFKTDFSNFYHSFYTHAIAWIIMGKENAKDKREDSDHFANLLDHVIRTEQDGETHGLPTSSLLTRIIVEFFMSKIDKEIREGLRDTDVTFNRYVDDIIFGYDNEKDLATIKRVLELITQKYDITINEKKTAKTTYNMIVRDSELIGYFNEIKERIKLADQIKFSDNISEDNKLNSCFMPNLSYNLKDIYDNFFNKIINEQLTEIKGSEKLAFRVLMFFINDFTLPSNLDMSEYKETGLFSILNALIAKNNSVDLNIQSTFIEKMLQLTLSDTRLILPFIQLIDTIAKKEKIIAKKIGNQNFAPVTSYLKSTIESMGSGSFQKEENFFAKKLLFNIRNNLHQEAYAIFLLFTKLNINISNDLVENIYTLVQNEDVSCDDFTLLFLVNRFVQQAKSMSLKEKNDFFDMLENLLTIKEYDTNKSKERSFKDKNFLRKHWLLRYEILYLDKTNKEFSQMVDNYYNAHSSRVKNLSYKYFKKNHQGKYFQISEFYFDLLKANIDFAAFDKMEKKF